jgi:hypothetical protein
MAIRRSTAPDGGSSAASSAATRIVGLHEHEHSRFPGVEWRQPNGAHATLGFPSRQQPTRTSQNILAGLDLDRGRLNVAAAFRDDPLRHLLERIGLLDHETPTPRCAMRRL